MLSLDKDILLFVSVGLIAATLGTEMSLATVGVSVRELCCVTISYKVQLLVTRHEKERTCFQT